MLAKRARCRQSICSASATQVTVLDDLCALGAFLPEWRAFLARRSRPVAPFQTPDWLLPVMRHQCAPGGERRGRIVLVHDEKGLALVAPFSIVTRFRTNVVEWLGEPMLCYGGVVAREDCDLHSLLALAIERLGGQGDRVDALHLRKVPGGAMASQVWESAGLQAITQRSAPFVDFRNFPTFEAYLGTRNAKTLKGYRRKQRKLEELGRLSFQVHRGDPRAQELGRRAVEMKIAWMAERGVASRSFADPACLQALNALLGSEESGACVFALLLDDEPIALEIGFVNATTYYSYIGAMGAGHASLSPGNIQIMETLRWCFEQGIETFDFLSPESEYKLSWATASAPAADWSLALTPRGRLYVSFFLKHMYSLFFAARKNLPVVAKFCSQITFGRHLSKAMVLFAEAACGSAAFTLFAV